MTPLTLQMRVVDGQAVVAMLDRLGVVLRPAPKPKTVKASAVSSTGAKSGCHRHAARHLAECQASDAMIEDYGSATSHTQFCRMLKKTHARKFGFWQLVEG